MEGYPTPLGVRCMVVVVEVNAMPNAESRRRDHVTPQADFIDRPYLNAGKAGLPAGATALEHPPGAALIRSELSR